MGLFASVPLAEIKARGSIKDADVVRLRNTYLEAGAITAADADILLSLNDACPIQDPAWQPCFVELMTAFLLEQIEPAGYMNVAKCRLLHEIVARDGRVEMKTKLDLLINIIATSRWTPQSLVVFALDQVRRAVCEGTGPLRDGRQFAPATVTDGDAATMQHILQSFSGEGSEGITRAEMVVLIGIDLATAQAPNHSAWRDLFVAAFASAMLAASGYKSPPRSQTLAAENWAIGASELDNILSGMVGSGGGSMLRHFKPLGREEQGLLRLNQQKVAIVTREEVPAYDVQWIVEHLAVAAHRTPNVMALLRLMKAESPPLAPRLQALLDQTPAAAA